MKALGRSLQLFALVLLPLAIVMQLSDALGRIGVDQMLVMLLCGIAAFMLGRVIEGYASS